MIAWSADNLDGRVEDKSEKGKEEWQQGSYRGARVGLCAARQELPVFGGKACRGERVFSYQLSVLSFE